MAMYALAIAPLVKECANDSTQVWYADNASAGGTVSGVSLGGKSLLNIVPSLDIFLKQANHPSLSNQVLKRRLLRSLMPLISLLPMKEECIWESLLGTTDYCNQCICDKVQNWGKQVENLAKFAESQPHAAFSTFAHGVVGGWMYFMRMVPLSCN